MSQEPNPPHPSEVDYATLKRQFADTLLATDSPVADEAAFKRDRQSYVDLLEQRKGIQKQIKLLQSETENISEAEGAAQEAESQLQVERKQLLDLAKRLGEAAFAGLQSGAIADAHRFKDRKDLQSRIDDLKRQKSALTLSDATGFVEQASLKAQDLKLLGQIKVEELKIGSTNRELGKDILSAKAEDAVRCDTTTEILGTIKNQRLRIAKAKKAVQVAEENLANAKRQAADTLSISEGLDSASLRAQLKRQQSALNAVNAQIEDLQEAVVEKALGYEWLRDNPALREPLERLAQLKEESTPRKLSVWPLATVVIVGHLFSTFGSQPLNLSAFGVLSLYLATGLGGLGLLAYYKPELVAGERRYKSVLLLFVYSIASIVMLLTFQSLADHALANWTEAPSWSRNRYGIILDLPRRLLLAIGQSYRVTFGAEDATSPLALFQHHLLSVGLCEELLKLAPALVAFAGFSGPWRSRTKEFNSQLVYLAMIGGLAFGLGEAVYYHFQTYAPMQAGWGIYAARFLSCIAGHAALAGISGWVLAHVTGGWIRKAFTTVAHGWGPVGGCVLIGVTTLPSNLLHTSYNLSQNPLWQLAWDVATLILFAWLIRCSQVSQLIPEQAKRLWKRGLNGADVAAVTSQWQLRALGNTDTSSNPRTIATEIHDDDFTNDTGSREPALWNPNAAGFWSLLLSPVFGAWLHAKNWKSLNEPEKSKRSLYWVYGSVAVLVVSFLLPSGLSNLIWTALVVSWWLGSGNEQHRYVNEQYPDYRKKRWGTPLSIGGLCVFGLALISFAVEVDNASHEAISQLAGTWSSKMQHAEVDKESGVEVRMEFDGTTAFIADGTSSLQGDVTMTYRAPNGEQAGLVLKLESEGTWSFDGTTLREFTKKISIEPGDVSTRAWANNDPQAFADLRREMELTGDRSYGTVTFSSDDEVDLTDHETGLSASMRRIRPE